MNKRTFSFIVLILMSFSLEAGCDCDIETYAEKYLIENNNKYGSQALILTNLGTESQEITKLPSRANILSHTNL